MIKRILILCLVLCFVAATVASCKNNNDGKDNVVDIPTAPATSWAANPTPTQLPGNTVAPQDTPSAAPTEAPTLAPNQVLHLNVCDTDLHGLSEAECEAWFSDAVFVGDSIMIGWKNYNNTMLQSNQNFFGQTRFLCEGSYGAGHALEPVSETSLHPIFGGQQQLVETSIAQIGANKVFICFGLNDIAIYGVDGTVANFNTLVNNIKSARPQAEIYIISAMYMYQGSEQRTLNNENLRKLNDGLRALCAQMGMQFIDIASHLVNEQGYLKPEYSSDQYVHQTASAYAMWAQILRSVAANDILNKS